MKATGKSVMQAPSFKPELEFEVIKLALLRERYISRLQSKLSDNKGKIDMAIIGTVDVLRDTSIEIVDTIKTWERTQISYPDIKPFMWNNQEYLCKMCDDMSFLLDYPNVSEWLGFLPTSNPFLLPPEILLETVPVSSDTFIVFGKRPLSQDSLNSSLFGVDPKKPMSSSSVKGYNPSKMKKLKYLHSSPYATPVLSDPNLLPSETAEAKAKKRERDRSSKKKNKSLDRDSLENCPSDFFECFVGADLIRLARKCWKLLQNDFPDLGERYSTSFNITADGNVDGTQSLFISQSQNIVGSLPWSPTHNQSIDGTIVGNSYQSSVFSQHSVFQASIDETGISQNVENQSMRLNTVSSCKTWTPHELAIQRVVRKRGGELHILTAAGTKGRMKPPNRPTRFERLVNDFEHTTQQLHTLRMLLEEMEFSSKFNGRDYFQIGEAENKEYSSSDSNYQSNKDIAYIKDAIARSYRQQKSLKYQIDCYKLVYKGDLKDGDKLRTLKMLENGEAHPTDEALSTNLEEKMARRIHSLFIRGLAKSRLSRILEKREKSILLIQNSFRVFAGKKRFQEAVSKMKFAESMRKIESAMIGKARILGLKKHFKQKEGAKLIQRAWRGAMGRNKIANKKQFFKDIKTTNSAVSVENLTPGMLESAVEEIDDFMHDHNRVITANIVTVVRGIMFCLNGDKPEIVSIMQDDEVIQTEVYAREMSWADTLRILRRKGRLLRRLRMLARRISLPNASPLEFTSSCLEHLKEVSEKVFDTQFRYFNSKRAIIQLLTYLKSIKAAYDKQDMFPEYFGASSPIWFRILIDLRLKNEMDNMEHCTAQVCCDNLNQLKENKIQQGKKWGLITNAYNTAMSNLAFATEAKSRSHGKMNYYIEKLVRSEENKIKGFESLEETTRLGLKVAKRELQDYLNTDYPKEDTIKMFNNVIDEKSITLRDVLSNIIMSKQNLERDKEARSFEHLLNFEGVYESSRELGTIVANLLMLKEQWDDFVDSIGGLQFVNDLYGEKLNAFESMKKQILEFVKRRRDLKQEIKDEIYRQLNIVKEKAAELRDISYAKSQEWDTPFSIVVEYEEEEDLDAARRDVQAANRKLRAPNHYAVEDAPIVTVLLLVDCKIPKKNRNQLVDLLFQCNYSVAETLKGTNFGTVLPAIQNAISNGKSAILFVEKGIDFVTRSDFNACFRTALQSLAPTPRVLSLDGTYSLTAINWYSDLAPVHNAFPDDGNMRRSSTQLLIARARGYIGMMRHCVVRALRSQVEDQSRLVPLGLSAWENVPQWLHRAFLFDIEALRQQLYNMYYPKVDVEGFNESTTLALSQNWTKDMTGHTPPYIVLAAAVTAILGLWVPPVTTWRGKHFREGVEHFLSQSEDITTFMDKLQLSPYPITDPTSWARIAPVMKLHQVWNKLRASSLYENPFVFILSQWVLCSSSFMRQGCEEGGTMPIVDDTGLIESTRELDWDEDVMAVQFDSVVADILHETMAANQIYTCDSTPVITYIANRDYMDISYQMMEVTVTERKVTVYQNGSDIYVEVMVDSADARGRAGITQTKRYFTKITSKEYVAMSQPNSTEIFEGKIPRYNFDEKFEWPKHAAKFTRLVVPREGLLLSSDSILSQTARAKFMQVTVFGLVNGHFIRVEFFEECFGVITGTVYGVSKTPVNFVVDDDTYDKIVAHCDNEEERYSLEHYDATTVPWILADRLEICPPKRFIKFFNESQYPKNIPKRVKFRVCGGPGRLCGHYPIIKAQHVIIVSVYELHGAGDAHKLRICLYEPKSSRKVEYRLSPLERRLLFDVNKPLLGQILERIKCVVVDAQNTLYSPLLILHTDYAPQVDNLASKRMYDIVPPSAESENDEYDDFTLSNDEKYFGVTFDRAACKSDFGNLEVGICLCEYRRGFICTVYDKVGMLQVQRMISYATSCSILIGKDLAEMKDELKLLNDHDTVLDMVEDLMAAVEIIPFEDIDDSASGAGGVDDTQAAGIDTNRNDDIESRSDSSSNRDSDSSEATGLQDSQSQEINEMSFTDESKFVSPLDYKGMSVSFVREDEHPLALACVRVLESVEDDDEPESKAIDNSPVNDLPSDFVDEDKDVPLMGDADDEDSTQGRQDELGDEHELLDEGDKRVVHASEFGEGDVGYGYIEESVTKHYSVTVEDMPPENRVPIKSFYNSQSVCNIETDLGDDEVDYGYVFPKPLDIDEERHDHTTQSLHSSYTSLAGRNVQYEKSFVTAKSLKKIDLGKTRICWRSRIMPKQSKINAKDQEKAMLKRSSRVIQPVPLREIPVVEDPLYLKNEENSFEKDVNKLPVIVLEILNESPGIVDRKYRIELSANNGEKIGSVDILDDDDLHAVVGYKMKHLLMCEVDDRDMDKIFSYVMEDRLILNMMGTEREDRKGGRRVGLFTKRSKKKKNDVETGQVLELQRDTPSMLGDSDSSSSDSDSDSSLSSSCNKYWLRLYTCRHRMAGIGFRTTVMFEGENEHLYYRPNRYFDVAPTKERIMELNLTFNCENLRTRQTTYLTVAGEDLWEWMPNDPLDLSHDVRRRRFGKWLIGCLHLRYSAIGKYDLYLTGMDREKCNSRDINR